MKLPPIIVGGLGGLTILECTYAYPGMRATGRSVVTSLVARQRLSKLNIVSILIRRPILKVVSISVRCEAAREAKVVKASRRKRYNSSWNCISKFQLCVSVLSRSRAEICQTGEPSAVRLAPTPPKMSPSVLSHVRVHHVDKGRDDPQLREVLAQRPEGGSRSCRRHIITY
ncbi:hypothetical protein BU25DRAFT_416989 [Macroventuria anomochaeta]|uniref:Uncharacterized protein n=1 Tax=Macroventuria anomochaeta TaxID=301207 RepID=A0ACB6SKB3_9PLEO|nr:uncharacterized protein BU25DRAFT_416989 [Macroventuria anomochaeta]KAF2633847.1 hypothetical protein BU25DRAFT_416989 [Macroventuria anomochaeta]